MKHLTKYTIILLASLTSILGFAQTGSPIYDNVGENYFTQSPLGSDSLLQFSNSAMPSDTYWITDDVNTGANFGGTVPTDVFYLEVPDGNDKIYVYGKRNIVVIDAVTQETVDIIENISFYSQFYPTIEQTNYLNYNYFAYNEADQKLYCATEDANMVIIDLSDNSFTTKETPWSLCGNLAEFNYFLKYDTTLHRIYYAISTSLANEIFIYDVQNDYELMGHFTFNANNLRIRGLEINENENEFYLSLNDQFYRIAFDPSIPLIGNNNTDFYPIGPAYGISNSAGDVLFVKQKNADDKLFCFPNGGAGSTLNYYILNLTTKTVETQQCPSKVTAACFDGTDKVYISYFSNYNQTDLRVIDIDDYSYGTDVNTRTLGNTSNKDITMDLGMLNDKVLISKSSEVTLYDPSSGNVSLTKTGENHYFSRIAVAPDTLTAYAINTWDAGLDAIVDQTEPIEYSLNLGGIAYHACFNKHNGRIYFYNKHIQETGKVYIFNTANNSFAIVEIDGPISDIDIDPVNHNALVSTFNNSHFLKVIQDDGLLSETQWIEIEHGFINEMYVSPEENLYCMVGEQDGTEKTGIEIGNFDSNGNYSTATFLEYNTSTGLNGYLTSNQADGDRADGSVVYAAIDGGTSGLNGTQQLLIINDADLTQTVDKFEITENVIDIVFNIGSSTVYMAHNDANNTISIFNLTMGDEAYIETVTLPTAIRDIESNSLNDFIYVLHGSTINKLSGLNISNTPITDLYSLSSSMYFNADNSMLYVHVPYVKLGCNDGDGGVYEILDNNSGNPYTQFFKNGNFNRARYTEGSVIPANHDIVFDNEAHRLYYGGSGHSNIIGLTIESFYRIPLDDDPITWLSVPRHLRSNDPQLTPTSTVFAQGNITGGYTDLQLDHNEIIPGSPHDNQMVWAKWDVVNNWHYNDNESIMKDIHSTRGYKLEIFPNTPIAKYLELEGSIQDPNTVFPLYCHEENWTGYFLAETQSVFNALGDALPYVYHVEHEDYTCYRYNFPVPNCNAKSANGYPPGTWICDGRPNIRFGDMVIVKSFQDIPNFSWQQSNYPPSDYTRSEVVYYTYDELTDYSTFVIELDTTQENPEEMGAFINDTCVGACSVNEGDSVVVLRAYLGEQAGDSVVFEEHFASKSTNNIHVTDYYVLNPESGLKEKRVVKTGEGRDVFIVSFRKEQKGNTPDLNRSAFNIWPNPSSGNLFYSFMLEDDANVRISIFDIGGKLVANPVDEPMQAGNLTGELSLADFSGNKLKPGVYLLKAKLGDSLLIRKVIVN